MHEPGRVEKDTTVPAGARTFLNDVIAIGDASATRPDDRGVESPLPNKGLRDENHATKAGGARALSLRRGPGR